MTNDEINRYITTEIMGKKCWHELVQRGKKTVYFGNDDWSSIPLYVCECGYTSAAIPETNNPDYCSDESPRRLLNEVVAKVLPTLQFENRQFIEQLRKHDAILLTAEQIATACVEAHKALKEKEL